MLEQANVTRSQQRSQRNNKIAYEKATWLNFEDGEEKEEKEKRKYNKSAVRGIYKRSVQSKSQKQNIRPASNPDLYMSRVNGQSIEARSTLRLVGKEMENKRRSVSHDADEFNNEQSSVSKMNRSVDLDFADKIQAFRALIKATPGNGSSTREETKKSKAIAGDITAHGGHIQFNAKSVEGRASAPNEFQLTYEQDRYLSQRNKYFLKSSLDVYGHEEKLKKAAGFENSVSERKTNLNSLMNHDDINEDTLLQRRGNDFDHISMSSQIVPRSKAESEIIIKRPSVLSEKDAGKSYRVNSILKRPTGHDREERERSSKYSQSRREDELNEEMSSSRFERNHEGQNESKIKSIAQQIPSPFHSRPKSINVTSNRSRKTLNSNRPQSEIPSGFSGRVHSSIGSVSPSFSKEREVAAGTSMSLQSHLNVLGASLSSLSTIVNGGDSSDTEQNELEHRCSPVSTRAMGYTGRSGDLTTYRRQTELDRRGRGRDTSSLNTSDYKNNHSTKTPTPSELSGTITPSNSVPSINSRERLRPRSDEYIISERLGYRQPNSPRVKQTNVKGMEEEVGSQNSFSEDDKQRLTSTTYILDDSRTLSPLTVSEGLGDVSADLSSSGHIISRYHDSEREYSLLSEGAKQIRKDNLQNGYTHKEQSVSRRSQNPNENDDSKNQCTYSSKWKADSYERYKEKSSSRPNIISRPRANDSKSKEIVPNSGNRDGDRMPLQRNSQDKGNKSDVTEKKRVIKRPVGVPRHNEQNNTNNDKDQTQILSQNRSGRSHTALGLYSSKEYNPKMDLLPSKYNAAEYSRRQRPHSAMHHNDRNENSMQSYSKRCGKDSSSSQGGTTLKLLDQVRHLHKEVDERLQKDENITHSITSSLNDLHDEDWYNDEYSDTILQHGKNKVSHTRSKEDKAGSHRKLIIRRKDREVVGRQNKLEIESGLELFGTSGSGNTIVMSTSTPRKGNNAAQFTNRHNICNDDTAEGRLSLRFSSKLNKGSKQVVGPNGHDYVDGGSFQYDSHDETTPTDSIKAIGLSSNLRKILEGRGDRGLPQHRYKQPYGLEVPRKERFYQDDDDKDEDDTMTNGSQLRDRHIGSELAESKDRKSKIKVISPFISKLATVDLSNRRGDHDLFTNQIPRNISGRASPADVLMGYLDNPNTVRLLQRLYQADPINREIIMIKVLYFKAWLHFSMTAKQKRLRKLALTECADTFCYQRVLALHFIIWERHARDKRNERNASNLYKRHMLSKGFRALQWSVSHSRHCRELIQNKYRTITTRATFDKWRNRATNQRHDRMQNTMQRWKQFVSEVHKIRHLQEVMDRNLMEKVYCQWRKCYNKHMKQRMAFNYFRHTLYKHTLSTWSSFVHTCKQKKEKYMSAVNQYQRKLTKTAFFQMLFAFKKSKKARNHFRQQKLNEVFWSWKQASQICRNERQQDLVISVEHCRVQVMKNSFRHWKQKMLICKADAHANSHLYRNTFNCWLQSYYLKFAKRKEIEITIERNKLHRSLLTWRRNVVQIKRRHKKAVILLETCLLHTTLERWRFYACTRISMRYKVTNHQKIQEKKMKKLLFSVWFNKYKERLDAKKEQLLWSESCARKLSKHWRHICHQRSLERRLEETQPERELRFIATMFNRWVMSLEKRRQEDDEAELMRKNLELRNLQKTLQIWRTATQKQLIIKPLIQRREQKILEGFLHGWHQHTRCVVDCRRSKNEFYKIKMRKYFISWRRRYTSHQVEKTIKNQFSQGLLICCFIEWRQLIQQKKRSHELRHKRLVTKMFMFWKLAATCQITKRLMLKEEETNNMELKRRCFVAWWENVHEMKASANICVTKLTMMRGKRIMSSAFSEWKHLFHSTLIARAYLKVFNQRLILTLLLEWHGQTFSNVSDAVCLFQEKIGVVEESRVHKTVVNEMQKSWTDSRGLEYQHGHSGMLTGNDDEMSMSINGTLSSSLTTGLFTRLFDEGSSIDSDADRSFLLSGGLQDAAYVHQNKCSRLRNIVTTAVWRLQHWPICVAFQQWQEFTVMQIGLKKAANQVKTIVNTMEMISMFKQWRIMHTKLRKARQHRDHQIVLSTFVTLHQHTRHCRHVKLLKSLSEHHLRMKVFCQYFPIWLQKAQKQRREKHVVTLWTSRTTEELELYPLEHRLTSKLNNRTLKLCFSLWLLKVSHVKKIRHVYETNTLKWVFNAWHEWASYRQEFEKKSKTMLQVRRVKMAFKKWCDKYRQSRQTEILYKQAWKNHKTQIFIHWHQWTKASQQRRYQYNSFTKRRSSRLLTSYYTVWKSFTYKVSVLQSRRSASLLLNVFQEWRLIVQDSKKMRQVIMQFQISSYTLLVKRLFQQWYSAMIHHKTLRDERIQKAENTALFYARMWRQKCQTLRGRNLQKIFQARKVYTYLQTWKLRFQSVQLLNGRLEIWQQKKNVKTLKTYLQTWVLNLRGNQISRNYTSKLLCCIVYEWRIFTKESRERWKRGLALTKALQERNLHVYFQFWVAITKVKVSVRSNTETRLQIRIMRSWHRYTCSQNQLRQLHATFTQKVNGRILTNAFTKLSWRAEYCNHLQEVADKIVQDRVRATLTAVIVLWKNRLDTILAARCYGGILVVRVVRQWCRFVQKRKAEREKELSDHLKAVYFDEKSICKRAFMALKELVLVSKMAERRRQRICDKYALIWKSRVDLQMTAMEMEWDLLCWRTWRTWRWAFIQKQTTLKVEKVNNRHKMSLAFKSWRRLVKPTNEMSLYQIFTQKTEKKTSTTSQLPVPKARGVSMSSRLSSPSSLSSSSSSYYY